MVAPAAFTQIQGGDQDNAATLMANLNILRNILNAGIDAGNILADAMENEVGILEESLDLTKLWIHNLVVNGDMESWADGTSTFPSGWATESTPSAKARDTADTGHGSYCLKITTTDANDGVKQTLTNMKVSTVYRVSARVKAATGDTAKMLTTGATTNLSETSTSTSWATITGAFTTDGSGTDVVLKLVGSGGAGDVVYFDSIVVTEGTAGMGYLPPVNTDGMAYCTASADDVDVTDAKVLVVLTSGASVTIGGLAGGKAGQPLDIIKQHTDNSLILEHAESSGTQKFRMGGAGDVTITGYGGMRLRYDGNYWYQITE